MTEQQAISLAKQVARVEGWKWLDPVIITKQFSRRSTKDRYVYDLVVSTNAAGRDCNIWIKINPDSGEVIDGAFHAGRNLPVKMKKWKKGV